jgi:hypothetical protein
MDPRVLHKTSSISKLTNRKIEKTITYQLTSWMCTVVHIHDIKKGSNCGMTRQLQHANEI